MSLEQVKEFQKYICDNMQEMLQNFKCKNVLLEQLEGILTQEELVKVDDCGKKTRPGVLLAKLGNHPDKLTEIRAALVSAQEFHVDGILGKFTPSSFPSVPSKPILKNPEYPESQSVAPGAIFGGPPDNSLANEADGFRDWFKRKPKIPPVLRTDKVDFVFVRKDEELEKDIRESGAVKDYENDKNGSREPRRFAFVMNNLNFPASKSKDRDAGGKEDACLVDQVLRNSNFTVFYRKNCKLEVFAKDNVFELFIKHANDNRATAVVVFLMSHGNGKGQMQMTDSTDDHSTWVSYYDHVILKFKNDMYENLVGVPKMFFLQLCRGKNRDAIENFPDSGPSNLPEYAIVASHSVLHIDLEPLYSDILIAYSTLEGHVSWRTANTGSWFIQALCETIRQHGQKGECKDITRLLAILNETIRKRVGISTYEHTVSKKTGEVYDKQMCPFYNIGFTKSFYFNYTPKSIS